VAATPEAVALAQAEHHEIVRAVLRRRGRHAFATGGDGGAVAFTAASDGIMAAVEIERSLGRRSWPPPPTFGWRLDGTSTTKNLVGEFARGAATSFAGLCACTFDRM
jgi:hypothetical protein